MKRRWALRFLLFVCGVATALVLVLRTEWAGERLCEQAASLLSRVLREPVLLSSCTIRPLSARLDVEGIRLGSGDRLFQAHRLSIRLALLARGGPGPGLSSIELIEPELSWALPPAADDEADPLAGRPPSDDRCLAVLDHLPIRDLRIRDARLRLHLPDGSLIRARGVDLEVGKVERRRSIVLEVAEATAAPAGVPPIPVEGLRARMELDEVEERLDVERLHLEAAGVSLQVSGNIRRLCDPELGLRGNLVADLGRLGQGFAPELGAGGTLVLAASVAGPLDALRGDGLLSGSDLVLGEMEPGEFSARLVHEGEKLRIEELIWPVGEGRAIVRGEVELHGRWHTTAEVQTEGLPFHRLLAKLPVKNTPVMMTIDSVHRLEGHLLDGLELEGTSALDLHDFRVRNRPWHQEDGANIVEVPGTAHLEGRVRITDREVILEPASARFGGGTRLELGARLAFEEARGMRIQVQAPHFDLAHIAGHVGSVPLGGAGTIQALIDGPYEDPRIDGRFDMAGARLFAAELGRVQSEAISWPGQGRLHFQNILGEYKGTVYDATVDLLFEEETHLDGSISFRAGGRVEDVLEATREVVSPLAWLHENLSGGLRAAEAKVQGPLPDVRAEGRLELEGVQLLERPFDTLEAKLQVPDISRLVVQSLRVGRGEGRGQARGEVLFEGKQGPSIDSRLRARDLPIRDLLGAFGTWAELEGGAGANLHLRGPIDNLELSGELFGEGLAARGVALAPTRLSLETQAGEVIVRGLLVEAGRLDASVRLEAGFPFDANLDLDLPELASIFPEGSRLDGEVKGLLTASGKLGEMGEATGTVNLERLSLSLGGYRVESVREVALAFSGPAFVLFGLDLKGENTELSLYGNRSLEGQFDLQAHGSFDARLIGSLLPELEHPTGVIDVKASMTGTSDRPLLVGSAQIRRGTFRTRSLPIHVQDLGAKLTFSQNQVVVEEGSLIANGGTAMLRGTVSLRGFAPHMLDLVLQGEGMSWRKPVEWPAVVTGRVGISGEWPEDLLVSGELHVDRLRYAKDLDLEKTILDFSRKVVQRAAAEEREWVRFDLDLVGGGDMRVENNLVRARLQFVGGELGRGGRLRLVGNNLRLGLLGSVEVLDGLAYFRGNEYRVTNGMVDFKERDRIDPVFDISAETQVRDYRVFAHAFGRLGDGSVGGGYQLELRSEPMLAQADIVTLLTFGITSRDLDLGGNSTAAGAGMAAEALLTVSGLEDHVRRWLPNTPLLMDPDISLTTQFSELTGQMEPMAVFEAKVLTERLRLKTATPVATTKGRRASAEFRVSDTLSTQILWQNEAVGYSSGDLGFDLKLHWEWE